MHGQSTIYPPRVALTCEACGTTFAVKPSRAARGNVRFCSRACSDTNRPHPRKSLQERFAEKVDTTSSPYGCHLWTGHKSKTGYGHIGSGGKHAPVLRAHVVAWEAVNGPVPEGMELCHTCDVYYPRGDTTYRACVRHDHIQPGTHQENMDQMKACGRDNRIGRKWAS